MPKKRPTTNDKRAAEAELAAPARVRIIGGRHRGRLLQYDGDLRTRPMKDRVREAVFNLIGPLVEGKLAIDLFAGTGALGLEALSRGAARAIFIERHFPTAAIIEENIATLDLQAASLVRPADTFIWARRELPTGGSPWLVFCSPPYELYVSRHDDMLELIERLLAAAPVDSVFVVEADARFDFTELPAAGRWDVREYPPAIVAIRMLSADH